MLIERVDGRYTGPGRLISLQPRYMERGSVAPLLAPPEPFAPAR
jgi:hypothetical protein